MKQAIIILFLLFNQILLSQEQQKLVKLSVESGCSYSYSGVNGMLGFSIAKKRNEIGLGYRTSITHYSRYNQGNFMGMYINYNRYFAEEKKINFLFNLHYGNLFRKLKSPINSDNSLFQIHELYAGYGVSFKIKQFFIINTINYGAYLEKQKNFYKNETAVFLNHGPLIKLAVKYEFN